MENENRVRSVTIQPERDQAISPELALVDPELGRLARSRLPQPAAWSPSPRGTTSIPAPIAATKSSWSPPSDPRVAAPRRTLTAAMGAVGVFATAIPALLLGAVGVGMVASEVRAQLVDEPAPLVSSSAVRPPATRVAPMKTEIPRRPDPSPRASTSARTPTQTSPNPTPRLKARAAPDRAKAAAPAKLPPVSRAAPKIPAKAPAKAPAVVPTKTPKASPVAPAKTPKAPAVASAGAGSWIPPKAEVEARTFVLLKERVALWVPPDLLDRKTNLLVNNVQVVCRQVARTPRFDCRLEVGGSRRGWLLTAVAARDGSVKLTWRGRAPAR